MSKLSIENMRPINGRILIERLTEEEEYKGLLHVSEKSKEKTNFGRVKSIAEDITDSTPFTIDSIVVFPTHAGTVFLVGDKFDKEENKKEFRVIKESELLGMMDAD